jgi:NinB protein
MTRDPYTKRTLLLASEMVKETAKLLIDNAPLDPIKPIQVTIGEATKQRGLDANGYYWLVLNQIAEQGWLHGKRFNSDAWHEYAKRSLMQDEITTKDGEKRSKWIELPEGAMAVISTTQLEKSCFAEYTTLVEVFGAQELGVRFSVRPV